MKEPDAKGAADAAEDHVSQGESLHTAASRAADGLRDQISALRRQVKDAQNRLRAHEEVRRKNSVKP